MTIYYMAKILLYQNKVEEVKFICIRIFVQLIKIIIVMPFLSRGSLM